MVSNYFILEQLVCHFSASAAGMASANHFANGKPGMGFLAAGIGLAAEVYAFYNGIKHFRELYNQDTNRTELTDRTV